MLNLPRGSCPEDHNGRIDFVYTVKPWYFDFQCRRKAKAEQKVKVPRYNPLVNPNPNPPNAHALPLTNDDIQMINGEPYQMVMRYEKIGTSSGPSKKVSLPMKKIKNQGKLDELKAIQRAAQKQMAAIMKESEELSQQSAFQEFMDKANPQY